MCRLGNINAQRQVTRLFVTCAMLTRPALTKKPTGSGSASWKEEEEKNKKKTKKKKKKKKKKNSECRQQPEEGLIRMQATWRRQPNRQLLVLTFADRYYLGRVRRVFTSHKSFDHFTSGFLSALSLAHWTARRLLYAPLIRMIANCSYTFGLNSSKFAQCSICWAWIP